MATPIKITPPLTGKQSLRFNERIAESSKKRLSTSDKNRIFTLVEKVLSGKKDK